MYQYCISSWSNTLLRYSTFLLRFRSYSVSSMMNTRLSFFTQNCFRYWYVMLKAVSCSNFPNSVIRHWGTGKKSSYWLNTKDLLQPFDMDFCDRIPTQTGHWEFYYRVFLDLFEIHKTLICLLFGTSFRTGISWRIGIDLFRVLRQITSFVLEWRS
jgi:hypothetical protein